MALKLWNVEVRQLGAADVMVLAADKESAQKLAIEVAEEKDEWETEVIGTASETNGTFRLANVVFTDEDDISVDEALTRVQD